MADVAISPEVRDILARAEVAGAVVRLPPGQLARPLYEAVDKALRALGGKWDRRAAGHAFPFDPAPRLAAALGAGAAVDRRKALQFFQTPPALAARMAAWAVRRGGRVLEPSAGFGRLVNAALGAGALAVDAVEVDEDNAGALLRAFDVLHVAVHRGDFLRFRPPGAAWPAVLMNPPFARDQDVAHVRHAWDLLAPGGRLAAVVSGHALSAGSRACAGFRAWLGGTGAGVEVLPPRTFADEGTQVGAGLVLATKPGGDGA